MMSRHILTRRGIEMVMVEVPGGISVEFYVHGEHAASCPRAGKSDAEWWGAMRKTQDALEALVRRMEGKWSSDA